MENPLKHRIEYTIFVFFVYLLKATPFYLLKLNIKFVSFLFKNISKKHSNMVTKNLKIAFPDRSQLEISELKEKVYSHFSSIFIETMYLYLKRKPEKILKKIEVNNLEYIKNALNNSNGVILFSGHFGNWELAPFILSRGLNTKLYSIAREMDNPLVEKVVKDFREYMGSYIIYKKGSIRTILKLLNENKIVCFLIDQNTVQREAIFVDFFERKTSAITTVSQLHLKRETPVIPLFLHYEKDKIVMEIQEEVKFKRTGDTDEDIKQLTQKYTTMIEKKIKEFPEQWFWFHNRWKTKPQGEINEKRWEKRS